MLKKLVDLQLLLNDFFLQKTICVRFCTLIFLIVCNKPHANPTIIYENIKEIHILAVGGTLDFPILSHVLLCHEDYWSSGI